MSSTLLQVMVERIWLQGEEALVPTSSVPEGSVLYRVPGLDGSVEIRDSRAAGRAALEAATTPAGAQRFHENFDSPALVTIQRNDHSTIIELHEAGNATAPTYDVLWIASQVHETLPVWPAAWHLQSSLQDGRHSFIAILE